MLTLGGTPAMSEASTVLPRAVTATDATRPQTNSRWLEPVSPRRMGTACRQRPS